MFLQNYREGVVGKDIATALLGEDAYRKDMQGMTVKGSKF